MKHDLCTNAILVSQLSNTDVSPGFIHRHICQDATHTCRSFITLYLSSSVCHYVPFATILTSATLSFTLPPYIVTHIPLYSNHVVLLIIPSIFFAYGSVTPLSNAVGIPYWRLWWGMGGPVLLADFNELLWGSDRRCQKWRSAIQPTRFNAPLLTTAFSLRASTAGEATGRTTRAASKKHM